MSTELKSNQDAAPKQEAAPKQDVQMTEAELKAKLAAAESKKIENAKKIAEFQAKIDAAKKSHDKFAGMPEDEINDPDLFGGDKDKHALFVKRKHETLQNAISDLESFKLTLLTPAEKALREKWNAKMAELEKVKADQEALRAEIVAKYPDFFGATKQQKIKAEGAAPTKRSEGGKPTFQSLGLVLNSREADTIEVKRLNDSGVTGQSDIIRAIYGDAFDIGETTCPARIQIHSIRIKLGLVSSRA